jgi:CHAD domain-containing protein
MAANATETEIKYEAAPGATLPSFDELPEVARTEGAPDERLVAEYFDTEDLRLIRAGITLRRREGGHDAGWHLKLPAGNHSRREIMLPLGRARKHVPAELARLVRVHTRGQVIEPVARISTLRRRQLLLDSAGGPLAEVAHDDVTAQAMGAQARGGQAKASRWHEVEVELTGGSRELLDAADKLLRRHGLNRAGQFAKLARALDLPASEPARRRQTGPAAPAGDVLVDYIEAQVAALKTLDPMVRGNEPDAVHQMRTTTRRLRSTLQSFTRFFSGSETEPLTGELQWLGRVLGEARDAEVLAAHLAASLGQLSAEQVVGPVAARVRGHFASIGAQAQAAIAEALDSPRYFAVLDRLDQLVAAPPVTELAGRAAGEALPAAVRRAYKKTSRRMRRALRDPGGEHADVALHQARKAAKRARYAGEAVAPACGSSASRFAKRMKNLQSVLGEHQDAVIAGQVARELGMSAHLAGENAFTYGLLYDRDDQEADRLRQRAVRTWRTASRPGLLRWLC